MLFEVLSTAVFGGLAFKAYIKKRGVESNESGKIQRIISLSGLNIKDGKDTLTTILVRKNQFDWGWEYKYRIPLGRSFEDYLKKQNALEDGINNRRKRLSFEDLKQLNFEGNVIANLRNLWMDKLTDEKDVELSYDGLLIIRVYDKPLPTEVPFHPGVDWKVPVGITRELNTFKYHNFEVLPHLVLGGATTYGKSNFINSTINSLLSSNPDNVNFYMIDLKGGIELCDYEHIKQTVSIAYEPQEALETLQTAYKRMRNTQIQMRRLGKKNVREAGIKERHFVIVDEVGELNPNEAVARDEKLLKQECQIILSQIARLGASLGFRLILATQYPTGDVIPRQCKQNSDAKLSFRVQSATASRVVLDESGAELLPQIKGRAIYQTADKRETLQTPLITSGTIYETIKPHKVKKEVKQIEKVERPPRANPLTFEEV